MERLFEFLQTKLKHSDALSRSTDGTIIEFTRCVGTGLYMRIIDNGERNYSLSVYRNAGSLPKTAFYTENGDVSQYDHTSLREIRERCEKALKG